MKILILFNLKTVYKIKDMIFPMFDDVFTAKILGMWKKRGFTPPPHAGVLPLYWASITMDYSAKKNQVGGEGGWGDTFLKTTWNF